MNQNLNLEVIKEKFNNYLSNFPIFDFLKRDKFAQNVAYLSTIVIIIRIKTQNNIYTNITEFLEYIERRILNGIDAIVPKHIKLKREVEMDCFNKDCYSLNFSITLSM